MNKQVLSIEQMQHLKDLGVDTSKASMHWQYIPTANNIMGKDDSEEIALFVSEDYKMDFCYPTFTLQDMLTKMPSRIGSYNLNCNCHNYISYVEYVSSDDEEDGTNRYVVEQDILHCTLCKNLTICAYEMLCWLAENNHLNKE